MLRTLKVPFGWPDGDGVDILYHFKFELESRRYLRVLLSRTVDIDNNMPVVEDITDKINLNAVNLGVYVDFQKCIDSAENFGSNSKLFSVSEDCELACFAPYIVFPVDDNTQVIDGSWYKCLYFIYKD